MSARTVYIWSNPLQFLIIDQQFEEDKIRFGFFRLHFFGFIVPILDNNSHGGEFDFIQRENIVFHIATARNLHRLRLAPLTILINIVVYIVGLFGVLYIDFNFRVSATVKFYALKNIEWFSAKLGQGFESRPLAKIS